MVNTDRSDRARVKSVIVDDHPLLRDALMQLICREDDLDCIGSADNTVDAKKLIAQTEPDLLVLDLRLKKGDALDLIKTLRVEHPKLKILILSQYDELIFAERVLRAGASGYVMKENATEEILHAIRKVLTGEMYFSDRVAAAAVRRCLDAKPIAVRHGVERLSDRELQVFQLIGASCAVSEIAREFGLSVKTVETHRENIKAKLNLQTAAELHAFAQRWAAENFLPALGEMQPAAGQGENGD